MERQPDFLSDILEMTRIDPCRYVREADLALLYGSREEAVALIAKAYFAFDLALAECDELRAQGKAWPERSS